MSQLDVFSDVVCPWCFIGKRRLEEALASLPEAERPTVRWHAFQLDPTFPEGKSVPSSQALARKFGGVARMKQLTAHVAEVAKGAGIHMNFEQQLQVNTRLAHRAVALARHDDANDANDANDAKKGGRRADVVVEALFKAHFEDGKDLANVEFVASVLDAAGVKDARARLDAGEGNDDVDGDLTAAAEFGVSGVPFFILDERIGMSGAQPKETFLAFLAEAKKSA